MSVIFSGYYGKQNTGDDLFCLISDWAARKYWNESKVLFNGRNLPVRRDGSHLDSVLPKKYYFKGQNVFELLYQSIIGDKIIYAGGSVFHSANNKLLNEQSIFSTSTKFGSLKLGAVGVSLGPYRSSRARESIREYLNKFQFISLRDKKSYRDAVDMNLSIPVIESFDMAALLPEMYPIDKENKSNIEIGISYCDYQRYIDGGNRDIDNRRFERIIETVKIVSNRIKRLSINLLIINNHPKVGDRAKSLKIKKELKKYCDVKITEYSQNPFEMCRAIANCSFLIATRLHAGILSFVYKTPFIQVEYHEKCGQFLDSIDFDATYRIGDFEKDPNKVADLITNILLNNNKIPMKEVKELQAKAMKNFTETKFFL